MAALKCFFFSLVFFWRGEAEGDPHCLDTNGFVLVSQVSGMLSSNEGVFKPMFLM